jgi:hypothetical protein
MAVMMDALQTTSGANAWKHIGAGEHGAGINLSASAGWPASRQWRLQAAGSAQDFPFIRAVQWVEIGLSLDPLQDRLDLLAEAGGMFDVYPNAGELLMHEDVHREPCFSMAPDLQP